MPYTPLTLPDPYEQLSRQYGLSPSRPATNAAFPPLSEEEEESMLGMLGKKALGGLGLVGSILDKTFGGRAVRGLLGGKPREVLSILPLSDTIGITNEEDVVSGRDLLEKAGVLGPNTPGFDWGDVAGVAADIALDPSTYLTLGTSASLTAAGKAAKAAGQIPKTLGHTTTQLAQAATQAGKLAPTAASRIAAKQAGLFGLGLPFQNAIVPLGTGATAQKVAETLGRGKEFVKGLPGVKHTRALFSHKTGGHADTVLQQAHEHSFLPNFETGSFAGHREYATILEEAARQGLLNEPEFENLITYAAEHGGLTAAQKAGASDPAKAALAETMGMQLQHGGVQQIDARQALGIPARRFAGVPDPAGNPLYYLHREQSALPGQELGAANRPYRSFDVGSSTNVPREDILHNLDHATVNAMSTDNVISGAARTAPNNAAAAAYIFQNYFGGNAAFRTGTAAAQARKQARHLADYLHGLDPRHAAEGIPLFRNSPIKDYGVGLLESKRQEAAANAILDTLAAHRMPAGQGTVPATEALRMAGLTYQEVDQATGVLGRGGQTALAQKLGINPLGLSQVHVPQEVAESLGRYHASFQSPEALKQVVSFIDSATNLFKSSVTLPIPAFHTRNLVSGAFNNWLSKAYDATVGGPLNPLAYYQPYKEAWYMSQGKAIPDAARKYFPGTPGLGDMEATVELAKSAFAGRLIPGQGAVDQVQGVLTGLPGEQLGTKLPSAGIGLPDVKPKGWRAANPLLQKGVRGEENVFLPVQIGGHVSYLVEYLNRVSHFLAKKTQGLADDVATTSARATQLDYSALAPFEKVAMRRLAPFYAFSRQNLPFMLEKLATEPGRLAGSIRASNLGRGEGEFVPEYLGGGVALPVGERQDGQQRYLSQLGLPFEEAFGRFHTGPEGVQRTTEEFLGTLNPALKTPLELLTGRQFFSGRELGELHGPTGEVAADQLLLNSPLARLYSTGRTIVDPRKNLAARALNLGTGVKLTDVDVEKQKQIEGRNLLEAYLEQDPAVKQFQRFYVPEAQRSQLAPEEVQMLRLETSLLRRAHEAALKKKAAAGDPKAIQDLQRLQQKQASGR